MKDVGAAISERKNAPAVLGDAPLLSEIAAGQQQQHQQQGQQQQQPSMEEQQQLLQFLTSLEELRLSDPTAFEKTMNQLGIGTAATPDGASPKEKEKSQVDALQQLISSLKSTSDVSSVPDSGGAPSIVMPGVKAAPKGITISPTPGYVIKTHQIADDVKVFINLCCHDALDAPAMKKRLNDSGEEVEGLNIPMSVGAGRTGVAKEGKVCRVYDIIVNPQVLQEGLDDKSGKYRDFVAQLCIQSVENKYQSQLDRRYKLPLIKNNYMGESVESQVIQDRKSMPKIEEVTENSATARSAAAARLKKQADEARIVKEAMAAMETPLVYRLQWVHGEDGGGDSEQQGSREGFDLGTLKEHIDPIVVPAATVTHLAIIAEVAATVIATGTPLDPSQVEVKLSPFRLVLKLPGHRSTTLFLPCAVLPCTARCLLTRKKGYAQRLELRLTLPVDRSPWGGAPDPGSKQWLVTNALRSGGDDGEDGLFNPYDSEAVAAAAAAVADSATTNAAHKPSGSGERLPEERFHILPSDIDPFTGKTLSVGSSSHGGAELDDMDLPEHRFHRKDAASQYIIQQREQATKDKWAKHEKEKAERVNDPNIEYVDLEDYKPGGKLGGPASSAGCAGDGGNARPELHKASQVLAALAPSGSAGVSLSSSAWTELCD